MLSFNLNIGNPLAPEDVLSSFIVESEVECSLQCFDEETCVGYNYRIQSTKNEINCQLTANKALRRNIKSVGGEQWVFYQDVQALPMSKLLQV